MDVIPSDLSEIKVNFKGYVGDWKNNTGEDRGYLVDTATDLMKRYSLDKKGEIYQIIASHQDHILGRLLVRLAPPRLSYLVLKVNGHKHILLRSEGSVSLSRYDKICMEEIKTNFDSNSGIHLSINGQKIKPGEVRRLSKLCASPNNQVEVKRGPLALGRIFINMN